MRLKGIPVSSLRPLTMVSPSRFSSLQLCSLKEIWAANGQPRLLPSSPSTCLGTAIHRLLASVFQGRVKNEESLSASWKDEISRVESEMLENRVEKHLVPLKMTAFNYEVKKILAFELIHSLMIDRNHKKTNVRRSRAEVWVQTADGKVGGKIDLVRDIGTGVEIIDYKAGCLADESANNVPREDYQQQVKLYAALYNEMFGVWPAALSLMSLDQKKYVIEVDQQECSLLLEEAENWIDDIN